MPGSFSQAAFFYQNHIAALKLLDALEFGSPIRTITLDNYEKGPHIDDIIVESSSHTQYYQEIAKRFLARLHCRYHP